MQLARSWRERETRARRAPYRGMHLLSHCRVSARVQPASTPPRALTPLSSSAAAAATAAAGSGRGTRAEGERARTAPSAGGAGNASSFGDRAPRWARRRLVAGSAAPLLWGLPGLMARRCGKRLGARTSAAPQGASEEEGFESRSTRAPGARAGPRWD